MTACTIDAEAYIIDECMTDVCMYDACIQWMREGSLRVRWMHTEYMIDECME